MSNVIEIKVPDIGDFDAVDVIEVLVSPGDVVAEEDALITLESDKASMDVPSSHAGTVKEIKLNVGDKAAEGDVVCLMEVEAAAAEEAPAASAPAAESKESKPAAASAPAAKSAPAASAANAPDSATYSGSADVTCQMLVLGAGPGGLYRCVPCC